MLLKNVHLILRFRSQLVDLFTKALEDGILNKENIRHIDYFGTQDSNQFFVTQGP